MKLYLLSSILVILVGCASGPGHVKVGILDNSPRKANAGALDVIRPGQRAKPHREIAVLTYSGGANDEAEAIGAMANRARELGAEGLIIADPEAPYKDQLVMRGPIWAVAHRVFRGSAIIYTP